MAGVFSLGGLWQAGCCCGGGCGVIVCVSACPSGAVLPGATVTINSFTPCTTGAGGCCLTDIGSAGTYSLTVSATGYHTWSGELAMGCGDLIPIELRPVTDPPTVTISAEGCCGVNAPFYTITLSDGQTCTSDALGTPCDFWIADPGTYTYSITAPRFDPVSGSFVIAASCQVGTTTVVETLAASSGFVCVNWVNYPLPTTLHFSDSQYGAITINYDGFSLFTGTDTVSFPGGCGCAASAADREVDIDASCGFGNPAVLVGLSQNAFTHCPTAIGATNTTGAMTITSISATAPLVMTGTAGACVGSHVFPVPVTFTTTE